MSSSQVPLIELHIAGGTGTSAYGDVEDMELDMLMILEALGTRRGIGVIYQGGQYLPQDLVDAGRGMRL